MQQHSIEISQDLSPKGQNKAQSQPGSNCVNTIWLATTDIIKGLRRLFYDSYISIIHEIPFSCAIIVTMMMMMMMKKFGTTEYFEY